MKIKNKNKKIFFTILVFAVVSIIGNIRNAQAQTENSSNLGTTNKTPDPILYLSQNTSASPNNPSGNTVKIEDLGLKPGQGLVLAEGDEGTGEDNRWWYEKMVDGIKSVGESIENVQNSLRLLNPSVLFQYAWRWIIRYIFLGIPKLIVEFAGHIFAWVIKPSTFKNIVDNPSLYYIWTLVRDFLNIGFIMTLLFSAFCTIFQIEKYSFRSILRNLLIAALLVNFSFPITRFLIDFSNVLMYYLVEAVGIKENFGSVFTNTGAVNSLTDATEKVGTGLTDLLYINMVGSLLIWLAITLLVIAVLFMIRTAMLVILIIFSPIAFVGMVVPIFQKYSDMWWDALIKYSFFGPIMMFMLYVALKLAEAMGNSLFSDKTDHNMPLNEWAITFMTLYSIPLITLWAGIIIAQKISLMGADNIKNKVIGYAGTAAKKGLMWGTFAGAGVGTGIWAAKKSGVTEGVKKHYQQFKQTGPFGSEKTAQRGARVAAALGVKGEEEKDMQRRKEEYKKNHLTKEEANVRAAGGDTAAALLLAENGDFEINDKHNAYTEFMSKTKNDNIKKIVETKTKAKRLDVVIDHMMEEERKSNALAKEIASKRGVSMNDSIKREALEQVSETEIGKLAPSKWKDQNIAKLVGYDEKSKQLSSEEKDQIKRKAVSKAYLSYSSVPKSQDKITDDMNEGKLVAGRKAGIW